MELNHYFVKETLRSRQRIANCYNQMIKVKGVYCTRGRITRWCLERSLSVRHAIRTVHGSDVETSNMRSFGPVQISKGNCITTILLATYKMRDPTYT